MIKVFKPIFIIILSQQSTFLKNDYRPSTQLLSSKHSPIMHFNLNQKPKQVHKHQD